MIKLPHPRKLIAKRLRVQVGLIVSLLLAVTIGLHSWHVSRNEEHIISDAATKEASIIAKSIANLSLPYLLTEDYASIETLLTKMAELPDVLSIAVCDNDGNIYSRVIQKDHSTSAAIYSAGKLEPPGDSRPLLTTIAKDRIVAWHPVFEGSLLGWVKIDYSLRVIHYLKRDTWKNTVVSGIVAVLSGIFLILLFLNRHMQAVGSITDFAKKLDERKGGTIEVSDGSLETEQLVSALNQTSQRLYEQDRFLQESEKKYRTLFEESKDVVFFSTFDGRFIDINNAGVELFGCVSREELLRIEIGNNLYADARDRREVLRLIATQGFIKDYEIRMKRKNGEPLIVLMTATGVHDSAGSTTAFRGILRDVTSERKLEEQLRHAQKLEAVGQLTGGIAHDFNNILTAIIGFSYILQSKLDAGSLLKSHADAVVALAEKAAGLTQNLLAFSSKQNTNPRPVQLNNVVIRLKKLLSKLIDEEIELVVNLTQDELVVMADSGQMDQVLMNLAANARDAMRGRGTLTIETKAIELDEEFLAVTGYGKSGRYALLKVSDTGEGMDRATVKRIFEPFFTTKEVGKGTGLGLSIVYGIVRQHNGYISVTSELRRGTTFEIYLPLIDAVVEPEQPRGEEAEPGGTETILLVEDDRELRTLMHVVLEDAGYSLIEAVDGEDAIAKFKAHREEIDLLLLDVIMPKKNGREVYDQIKTLRPDVKVLFMSAYPEEIVQKRVILNDGMPFVSKPVTPPALLRKIRDVVEAAVGKMDSGASGSPQLRGARNK